MEGSDGKKKAQSQPAADGPRAFKPGDPIQLDDLEIGDVVRAWKWGPLLEFHGYWQVHPEDRNTATLKEHPWRILFRYVEPTGGQTALELEADRVAQHLRLFRRASRRHSP